MTMMMMILLHHSQAFVVVVLPANNNDNNNNKKARPRRLLPSLHDPSILWIHKDNKLLVLPSSAPALFATTQTTTTCDDDSSFSHAALTTDETNVLELRHDNYHSVLRACIKHNMNNNNNNNSSNSNNTTLQLECTGMITKRRRLGSSLVFLDLVLLDNKDGATMNDTSVVNNNDIGLRDHGTATLQIMLRRNEYNNSNDETRLSFEMTRDMFQPGCRVMVQGRPTPSRNEPTKEILLVPTCGTYLQPNGNPQHLTTILQAIVQGKVAVATVARALGVTSHQLWHDVQTYNNNTNNTNTASLYQLAKQYLLQHPAAPFLWDPAQLVGSSNRQKATSLPAAPAHWQSVPQTVVEAVGKIDPSSFVQMRTRTTIPDNVTSLLSLSSSSSSSSSVLLDQPATILVGWIQNRRRFQNNITLLQLVDDKDHTNVTTKNDVPCRLSTILHPSCTVSTIGDDKTSLLETAYVLGTGAQVLVQGYYYYYYHRRHHVADVDKGNAAGGTFYATHVCLWQSSWRPKIVQYLVELVYQGKMDTDRASQALRTSVDICADITKTHDETARQWTAARLAQNLQDQNSRTGTVTALMLQTLNKYSPLCDQFPAIHEEIQLASQSDNTNNNEHPSSTLLRKSTAGSKWQRAKKPQLHWMMQQIKRVIMAHPAYGTRKLRIVDIGGGKGFLANFCAAELSDDVQVRVVDISARATHNGMMRAQRHGLDNIEYEAADATTVEMDHVDVVVGLHACGALSDVALGHAVGSQASFVICPCCYLSNPRLRVRPRGGSHHTMVASDWLGISPDELTALQQLAEMQGDIKLLSQASHVMSALRAKAVVEHSTVATTIEIKTFPMSFSSRNFCIIGKVS